MIAAGASLLAVSAVTSFVVLPTAIGGPVVAPPISTLPAAPEAPGAANTGIGVGVVPRVHPGDLTIRRSGTVVSGLDIRGRLIIRAPNVTVRDSVIRGSRNGITTAGLLTVTAKNAGGFLAEDLTIRPLKASRTVDGVHVNRPASFTRLNVSGTVDGMKIFGGKVRVADSYFHHFRHFRGDRKRGMKASHDDAIQVLGGRNHQIVGNSLQGARNAAVMVSQDVAAVQNLQISNNWIDNGACSINFSSARPFRTATTIEANRFGAGQRHAGCAVIAKRKVTPLVMQSNVWHHSGGTVSLSPGS